jgi:4-hydroxy-tetrahydrodipicolinate synthase
MPSITNYRGIIPAISTPFKPDNSIDEAELRRLASWLAGHEGVVAVMTNGHTGEVFSLTPLERAEVTRIVADELKGKCPVISSIVCEGLTEAAEHARLAKEAGAAALDVMPPHHWLRFGFLPDHATAYFDAIWQASKLDLIAHVYPAWTKASYSSKLMADLARLPYVKAFKVGQREMSKYARDIKAVRDADPSKMILTCHDEYLLASMVQGVDGALVGFASCIPQLIIDLLAAVKRGDLNEAMRIQALITPIKEAVYGNGEPTGEAHARMKTAMMLAGVIKSDHVRPPTHAPSKEEVDAIRAALANAGLLKN